MEFNLSPEEADLAASQEEVARLQAENHYLQQRVVILRAAINRLDQPEAKQPAEPEAGQPEVVNTAAPRRSQKRKA